MKPAIVEIGSISTYEHGEYHVFEWRIPHFSTLDFFVRRNSTQISRKHWSPIFSFGGEQWKLMFSANGVICEGTSGICDLHLNKIHSRRSIKVTFSISLKTANGGKYKEEHCTRDLGEFPLAYDHRLPGFISTTEGTSLNSELLPDDVLTVVCAMKRATSAGRDSDPASAEICIPASDSAGCSSDSGECRHCGGNFATGSLSSHQRQCEQRPVKCPDCSEVVVLQKFLNEHECLQERPEAENSGSNCVDTSTQTEEENGEESKNICVETSTQTGEENAKNSKDTRKESSTQTEEINGDEWFKEKSKSANVDASTQTEEQNVSLISPPEENDLMTDFKDLLKEGRGTDVTFKEDTMDAKTEFFAHQLILSLRSPYFADLFYGQGTKKEHQIIPLTGINTKAFEQMIRYCYDHKPCLQTTEDACALFKVASEFKVVSLQHLCHTFFRHTKIELKNVFSILEISVEMEDQSLQDTCYKFLQEHTRVFMEASKLCDVTPAMMYTLLNMPELSLNSEYELIKWVCDWAKQKAEDGDSSSKNAREYLENLLKYMNFMALTMVEFTILCKDNPGLFSSEEIISIYQNIACPGIKDMPDWCDKDMGCRVYTGSSE